MFAARRLALRAARRSASASRLAAPSAVRRAAPRPAAAFSTAAEDKPEEHTFKAETNALLDIVSNALYTEREVFLRELLSNASDSLEKLRHRQASGDDVTSPEVPLEIEISLDKEAGTLTISDTGVGMSKAELSENLGTIAKSGSKAFMKGLDKSTDDAASTIIGQFGVGFYSAFMVGSKVTVRSRSSVPGNAPHEWVSNEGIGSFTLAELSEAEAVDAAADAAAAPSVPLRGSSIVIELKDDAKEYCDEARVKEVIAKYSSFVPFPIKLSGEVLNTVKAVWAENPVGKTVTEEEYDAFYKHQAGAYDSPMLRLHFRADAPLDLKCLLFVPSYHTEKFGMGRMDPGVSLYSRKVLIEAKCEDALPEWCRFVRGVIDSEDLPLSISREKPQDGALLRKVSTVVTRKLLRFLDERSRKDADKYKEFWNEYGHFLKEGACQDLANQAAIAKLLRFESSSTETGEWVSFDEYVARMAPEQEDIYYLMAPDRGLATASPYYEGLKQSGREVLFVYNPIDEFVMSNLKLFNGRKLVSAEAADVPDAAADADEDAASAEGALTAAEAAVLCGWMKDALPDRLKEVKASGRLVSHPAMVTGHESASLRNMMRMVNQQNSGDKSISGLLPPQVLEINGKHEIVKRLHGLVDKGANAELCKAVSEQLVDNALISAGLIDDSRVMLPRLNGMLELVLGSASGVPDPVVAAEAPAPPAAAEASEAAPDADAAAAPSSSSK